jgi:hypothetical protein
MRRKPKPDKAYWFVKCTDTGITAKVLVRFADGTGFLYPDLDGVEYDGTWQELWDHLACDGFVAEKDAKRQGIIPSDWVPPQHPSLPIG